MGSPSCARGTRAAEPRHLQVEQHEAGDLRRAVPDRAKQMERFEAVLGGHGVKPFRRQSSVASISRVSRIVFDDQDVAVRRADLCRHGLPAIKSRAASAV